VDSDDKKTIAEVSTRLQKLRIDGLICVGGDGTLNGMQALSESLPTVLAPKTIDNDLGLNYHNEQDEWVRQPANSGIEPTYKRNPSATRFHLEQMVNYVTPGFATAVFVSARGVNCIRTTAESHRRIAIVEVMGRHSGFIALGCAYSQPDILLIPEHPLNVERLVKRVLDIYDLQKHVVILCSEGIVGEDGHELGASRYTTDPAGNIQLNGAGEALRQLLIEHIPDDYFTSKRRNESSKAAIFTRKVGHTQRGGPPILFDRYYAAQLGGQAVEMLLHNQANALAVLQWNRQQGFYLDSIPANDLRDRHGHIHARRVHPSFYDPELLRCSPMGNDYLLPIFTDSVGPDDTESFRLEIFNAGNLVRPYHSVNTDIHKQIRYLD
jgi:ATP-dependent phosphofructokinase / diphosphate-dependent phosphofructokinase